MKSALSSMLYALLLLLPVPLYAVDAARVEGDLKVHAITFSDSSTLGTSQGLVKNRGDWSAAALYSAGDVVQSGGTSYVCTTANTNISPPNASYWALLAAQGPQGPIGPAGAQGPQGIQGVAGPEGPIGLTGATGPAGAKGDTGATGAQGAPGTNGKTVLSGTIDPAAGIGVDGDFYINTASNRIFGPKASGTWPAGVSLVGPTGATGPAGTGYTPPRAPVLATGQVKSYAVGDDGDWMSGASLPAAQRFFDNGDGTVKDNLTGLIWLKNAICTDTVGGIANSSGYLSWAHALIWSNNLASGSCGLTDGSFAGQWRLPSRTELMSLVDFSQNSPALPTGHPFNSQSYFYWSASTFVGDPTRAWCVYMVDGRLSDCGKSASIIVWPVRGGQ